MNILGISAFYHDSAACLMLIRPHFTCNLLHPQQSASFAALWAPAETR